MSRQAAALVLVSVVLVSLADRSGEGLLDHEHHEHVEVQSQVQDLEEMQAIEAHAGGTFQKRTDSGGRQQKRGKSLEQAILKADTAEHQEQTSLLTANSSQELEHASLAVSNSTVVAKMLAEHLHVASGVSLVQVSSGEGSGGVAARVGLETEKATSHHKISQASRYVLIRGATGVNSGDINGDYVNTGKLYNGKPLFQKESNADRYLRFVTAQNLMQWRVSTTDSVKAGTDKGFLYCSERGLENPADCVNDWYVWSGSTWERQAGIVVLGEAVARQPSEAPGVSEKASADISPLAATTLLRWMVLCVLFLVIPVSSLTLILWFLCFWRTGKSCPAGAWPPTAASAARWCFPLVPQQQEPVAH